MLVYKMLEVSSLSTEVSNIETPFLGKPLPEKFLVAYTTNDCQDLEGGMGKVTKALEDGVNVLIWCFAHFHPTSRSESSLTDTRQTVYSRRIRIKSSQNLNNFRKYKESLRDTGYGDVIHLVAFGGWNGKLMGI